MNRTNTEIVAEEGGTTVVLTVSRSNGLESTVSVEWETQSDTAVASGQPNYFIQCFECLFFPFQQTF